MSLSEAFLSSYYIGRRLYIPSFGCWLTGWLVCIVVRTAYSTVWDCSCLAVIQSFYYILYIPRAAPRFSHLFPSCTQHNILFAIYVQALAAFPSSFSCCCLLYISGWWPHLLSYKHTHTHTASAISSRREKKWHKETQKKGPNSSLFVQVNIQTAIKMRSNHKYSI